MTEIGYHFTNSRARWGDSAPWRSTGFVDNITKNGARCFLNIGVGDPVTVRHEFQHHGTRCNKPRVHGNRSVPAVILFDIAGLSIQPGYDSPNHVQVNEPIPPNRVLGWFEFSPGMSDTEFLENVIALLEDSEIWYSSGIRPARPIDLVVQSE